MDESCYFRAGVGVVLIDASGAVLAFERSDVPGAWQHVQGGVKTGESIRAAAEREVREETGIPPDRIEFVAEHPAWLVYELPPERWSKKRGRGQAQRWLLYRFTGTDADIDLAHHEQPEFRAVKRTTLAALAAETVAFRRGVYECLAEWGNRLDVARR